MNDQLKAYREFLNDIERAEESGREWHAERWYDQRFCEPHQWDRVDPLLTNPSQTLRVVIHEPEPEPRYYIVGNAIYDRETGSPTVCSSTLDLPALCERLNAPEPEPKQPRKAWVAYLQSAADEGRDPWRSGWREPSDPNVDDGYEYVEMREVLRDFDGNEIETPEVAALRAEVEQWTQHSESGWDHARQQEAAAEQYRGERDWLQVERDGLKREVARLKDELTQAKSRGWQCEVTVPDVQGLRAEIAALKADLMLANVRANDYEATARHLLEERDRLKAEAKSRNHCRALVTALAGRTLRKWARKNGMPPPGCDWMDYHATCARRALELDGGAE